MQILINMHMVIKINMESIQFKILRLYFFIYDSILRGTSLLIEITANLAFKAA